MMSHSSPVPPPQLAAWLMDMFSPHHQAEAIPGDLTEEFSGIAVQYGVVYARRWYWRQAIRTIGHLFGGGFRSVRLLISVLGAGLLGICGIYEILQRYQVYFYIHPHAFWVIYTIVIAFLIPMTMGFLAAIIAKGKEMIAALTLSLLVGAPGALGLFRFLAQWNDYRFHSPIVAVLLATTFVSPAAIMIGGYVSRKVRPTPTA